MRGYFYLSRVQGGSVSNLGRYASWFVGGVVLLLSAQIGATPAIVERIKPVGEVYIEGEGGDAVAEVVEEAEAPALAANAGETRYSTTCLACHATGAAGAPKVGDVAEWSARLEKGVDTLVSNAINGINAMPPRGTCGSCSDEEIKVTVEYMLEQSR